MRPGQRKRPAGHGASSKSLAGNVSILSLGKSRRYWARQLIDRAPRPLPTYGSAEWFAADTATKYASLAAAAECWAYEADDLENRGRREVTAFEMGMEAGEEAADERQAAHRDGSDGTSPIQTFMERLAAQQVSNTPRPDDYDGEDPA